MRASTILSRHEYSPVGNHTFIGHTSGTYTYVHIYLLPPGPKKGATPVLIEARKNWPSQATLVRGLKASNAYRTWNYWCDEKQLMAEVRAFAKQHQVGDRLTYFLIPSSYGKRALLAHAPGD